MKDAAPPTCGAKPSGNGHTLHEPTSQDWSPGSTRRPLAIQLSRAYKACEKGGRGVGRMSERRTSPRRPFPGPCPGLLPGLAPAVAIETKTHPSGLRGPYTHTQTLPYKRGSHLSLVQRFTHGSRPSRWHLQPQLTTSSNGDSGGSAAGRRGCAGGPSARPRPSGTRPARVPGLRHRCSTSTVLPGEFP